MATLTIRGLDDETHARLRVMAAEHGRSMEAEVRAILQERIYSPAPPADLGTRIHERFAAIGGADLEMPPRTEGAGAAAFES